MFLLMGGICTTEIAGLSDKRMLPQKLIIIITLIRQSAMNNEQLSKVKRLFRQNKIIMRTQNISTKYRCRFQFPKYKVLKQ